MTPKKKASRAMSRYIRLRDALTYCRDRGIDPSQFPRPEDIIGKCSTCGTVKSWIYMDAGHWKTRGIGGSSGAYFMEENINLQCKRCNAFEGGKPAEMEEYIRNKYGEKTVERIVLKHYIRNRMSATEFLFLEKVYIHKYNELLESI